MNTLKRLLKFVTISPSGCWEFQGARYGLDGHRALKLNGKQTYAHRTAYQLMIGEIPEGHIVRHKCDNPACIKPGHLETGTQRDNMHDKARRWKGRAKSGVKGLYESRGGWKGDIVKDGKHHTFFHKDRQVVIDWLDETRAKLYPQ